MSKKDFQSICAEVLSLFKISSPQRTNIFVKYNIMSLLGSIAIKVPKYFHCGSVINCPQTSFNLLSIA